MSGAFVESRGETACRHIRRRTGCVGNAVRLLVLLGVVSGAGACDAAGGAWRQAALLSEESMHPQIAGDPFTPLAELTRLPLFELEDADVPDDYPVYAARSFNSKTHLCVFVVPAAQEPEVLGDEWHSSFVSGGPPLRHYDRLFGVTPAEQPLAIPPCRMWYVVPHRTVHVDEVRRVVIEERIPGLRMPCATDEFLSGLGELKTLKMLAIGECIFCKQKVTAKGLQHLGGLSGLVYLDLRGLEISGDGLGALHRLTELRGLDLSETLVTDDGLLPLVHCTGLRHLRLLECKKVKDRGLRALTELKGLERLDLGRTQVTNTGLVHLAGLTRLKSLDLHRTYVGDVGLAHLAGLSDLSVLDLSGTGVGAAGLAHLSRLASLRRLYLSDTRIEDITDLKGLKGLQVLDLSLCRRIASGGWSSLADLSALRDLDLSWTSISDEDLACLSGLATLRRLNLSGCKGVTSVGLLGGSRLQELDLSATQITDAGLAHLEGMIGLKRVELIGCTGVTASGADKLRRALPEAEIVRERRHGPVTDRVWRTNSAAPEVRR